MFLKDKLKEILLKVVWLKIKKMEFNYYFLFKAKLFNPLLPKQPLSKNYLFLIKNFIYKLSNLLE